MFFNATSIDALHFVAFRVMSQMPRNPNKEQKMHSVVITQPTPMASIHGAATNVPMQLRMLRRKLLTATPAELRFRTNSVSIVVPRVYQLGQFCPVPETNELVLRRGEEMTRGLRDLRNEA